MNNLRKDLELVQVVYENSNKKAVLKFLDEENGELLEVNFNKQIYDNGQYIDDEEKEERVKEWCKTYFDKDFDSLSERVGDRFDVYKYPKFNSMWEAEIIEKFDKSQSGMIFETKIEGVKDTGIRISITYKIDGSLYETKMNYSEYLEDRHQWFPNPQKKNKQYEKFKDKFGVSVEDADEIIGKEIMIEVKVAFGKYAYGDIKKPSWAK